MQARRGRSERKRLRPVATPASVDLRVAAGDRVDHHLLLQIGFTGMPFRGEATQRECSCRHPSVACLARSEQIAAAVTPSIYLFR